MMIRRLLFMVFAMGLGVGLQAQESLSLADAIAMGLENNFSIRIEKRRADIARNNNNIGEAGMLPTFDVGLSQNFTRTEIDNPASFLRAGNIKGNSFNPTANLGWTLFGGFNVQITRERLAELEKQSLGNVRVVVENTIQSIILAYYTAQLEKNRLDVFHRTLELSRDRYDRGKLRGEFGTAVTFDILQDKTAYLTDSSNLVSQNSNSRNAIRNLNLLMGVEVGRAYELMDSLFIDEQEYNFDDLNAQMASSNNNLRNQYITQDILRKDVELAKSGMFPLVRLTASGSDNFQTQDLSSAVFAGGENGSSGIKSSTFNLSAGVTLSYTLFDGGRIRRQLQNARINEQIGQLQIEEVKQSLQNSLLNTFDQYNLRRSLLNISEENVKTSELNLELATERYRNGTISSFDFRDIQVNYLTTSLNYLQAIYNLIESETELLRLTGGITEDY